MPLYEYYCGPCSGIFEAIRPMREAALPVPCPECNRDGERIMSSFNAFTFRDGYPRRLPDRGTYWHLGQEVKTRAKTMKGWTHPELYKPKPKPRPTRGERAAEGDKRAERLRELRHRDRWGVDAQGFATMKTKKPERKRKVIAP
ncbi:MAG TPA: zinc ribbon domain-containing protein [Dehalococcoidia bacterium]|nr:zinc ribbon domain-containing protein [Dehalococcoidia bacterium]